MKIPAAIDPVDPVAAVTHADPYPFYAALRDGPPLVWNERLRIWVASRADVIETLLQRHDVLRVRPVAEPVPRAIAGSPAGEVFGHLVRMNDGAPHTAQRPVLQRVLAGLDLDAVHAEALCIAQGAVELPWSDALFEWPIRTVARLLGFADASRSQVVQWMRDFVASLSPLSNASELQAASAATAALMARFEVLMSAQPPRGASLLAAVCREAGNPGTPASRALLCNLVGLLSQTCDATAGLIGNSLIALARERIDGTPWRAVVEETARHDPSVQNTRRFVASPVTLYGASLAAGDAVLLVLASANRDPALNPEPDRFLLERARRRSLGFGHGVHACPGQALACTLAAAALEALCTAHPERLRTLSSRGWRYRPSVNARIPDFQ
ncbi:MAG: cytochrome P450 [Comamonadaceae bacterium]|nr:MAG: cytochrome P450 [Comamonadaceae bacterium]